jgi:hypothetical protein
VLQDAELSVELTQRTTAGKTMRMPLSKQRNKHIQRVLVEAAGAACEMPGIRFPALRMGTVSFFEMLVWP